MNTEQHLPEVSEIIENTYPSVEFTDYRRSIRSNLERERRITAALESGAMVLSKISDEIISSTLGPAQKAGQFIANALHSYFGSK